MRRGYVVGFLLGWAFHTLIIYLDVGQAQSWPSHLAWTPGYRS